MNAAMACLSRRSLLGLLGSGVAGLALGGPASAQVVRSPTMPLRGFTGPDANPYWNGVNPFVSYPQKLPLLRMTDRGVQLETPRPYFLAPFTPNAAFYVRYHLELIPNAIDLSTWRFTLEGEGREVVQSFCGICHSPTYITMQPPLPGAAWEGEVTKMVRIRRTDSGRRGPANHRLPQGSLHPRDATGIACLPTLPK